MYIHVHIYIYMCMSGEKLCVHEVGDTHTSPVVRAVWDIHQGQEVFRARGRSPWALITSCMR